MKRTRGITKKYVEHKNTDVAAIFYINRKTIYYNLLADKEAKLIITKPGTAVRKYAKTN